MTRRISLAPAFLTEALEFQNRQRLGFLDGFGEKMDDFLCYRASLALGPGAQFLVQRIGQILNVERGYRSSNMAPLWRK